MTDDAAWVGAHYCGDRWLAVAFDADGYDRANVFEGIGDCWLRYQDDVERLLVDVPFGLSEDGDRECDRLARDLLGPQAAAVVSPPVPDAVRKRRYGVASRVHERQTGTPLPERAFAMSDAIAVLDDLLKEFPRASEVVAESNPELCYRAFAGSPLERDRGTAGGYAERMRTLASLDRDAPPAVQAAAEAVAGHDIAVTDVLDAMALAYTAWPGGGDLYSLPPDPPTDTDGNPMRLVYRTEGPLDAA
jgi:predicted RNase H-like nuclease